jgi:hypothetical protein
MEVNKQNLESLVLFNLRNKWYGSAINACKSALEAFPNERTFEFFKAVSLWKQGMKIYFLLKHSNSLFAIYLFQGNKS